MINIKIRAMSKEVKPIWQRDVRLDLGQNWDNVADQVKYIEMMESKPFSRIEILKFSEVTESDFKQIEKLLCKILLTRGMDEALDFYQRSEVEKLILRQKTVFEQEKSILENKMQILQEELNRNTLLDLFLLKEKDKIERRVEMLNYFLNHVRD